MNLSVGLHQKMSTITLMRNSQLCFGANNSKKQSVKTYSSDDEIKLKKQNNEKLKILQKISFENYRKAREELNKL